MSEALGNWQRSHYCGDLRAEDVGREVTLTGWVQKRRDHGGIIFVDLRDRTGLVQVVFDPVCGEEIFAKAEKIRNEYVVAVQGKVIPRSEETINPKLATGEVEIDAANMKILSPAKTPPFYIEDDIDVDEMVRLRYRYLDLRRPEMQNNILLRHKVAFAMREFMNRNGFWEIETPMLAKSTPEGAREYLVPSRVHPGNFYVLPQSPQLFKQILMVSGMDRYFQIVRCFRDEDLRADRQPEFTQLDIEMSFIEIDQFLPIMEDLVAEVFQKTLGRQVSLPLRRLTYKEAMARFGSDKPDLRFGIELRDIGDIVKDSSFQVFANIVKSGGQVKGICAPGCLHYSRKEIDDLTKQVAVFGAKGLAYIQMTPEGPKSPIAKFFTPEQLNAILERLEAKTGDLLMFVADKPNIVADSLGFLRQEIARRENLIDPDELNFLWITEFPLLEYDDEAQRWAAIHHPFTAPMDEDLPLLTSDPGAVRAKAYDIVLNGIELGGGSIRIHSREIQSKIFELMGMTPELANEKFGFLLEAFDYGVPPHGGMAFGLDRMIMLMAKRESIRDVIAFPKTQSATCMMTQAPSAVTPAQLRELGLKL